MNEFDIIEQYFLPLTMRRAEAGDLRDDSAILDVPAGYELVVSTDTLNEGVHFMDGAAPADIAHKALRTNLSDLAAMGAKPLCYQLALAFPERPSTGWLTEFTGALLADQNTFGIFCSGGDTTSIHGKLSISITAMGLVERGRACKRSGARAGDAVVLTGGIGDAWAGLQILQNGLKTDDDAFFLSRYHRPEPRFFAEGSNHNIHAAIDISDGFAADMEHVCVASGLAAHVDWAKVPLSAPMQKLLAAGAVTPADILSGGDDYELILAVPHVHAGAFGTVIGEFRAGVPMVHIVDNTGAPVALPKTGWTHF